MLIPLSYTDFGILSSDFHFQVSFALLETPTCELARTTAEPSTIPYGLTEQLSFSAKQSTDCLQRDLTTRQTIGLLFDGQPEILCQFQSDSCILSHTKSNKTAT